MASQKTKEVAEAMNEAIRFKSAGLEAVLDMVLNYFCEDSRNHQDSASDSGQGTRGPEEDCNDWPHSVSPKAVKHDLRPPFIMEFFFIVVIFKPQTSKSKPQISLLNYKYALIFKTTMSGF